MLEPFEVAGYRFVDAQDLSASERRQVVIALRDGLQQIEGGDRCETVAKDPDGDYPIMRFGVFKGAELVGAWWVGCNEQVAPSTPRAVRLSSVPHPGWTRGNFVTFFNATVTVRIGMEILNKRLHVRGGGTVTIVEFTFTADTANPKLGPLPEAAYALAKRTAGITIVETAEGSRTRFTMSRVGG